MPTQHLRRTSAFAAARGWQVGWWSTKPEVHFVKYGYVVSEMCELTDRQTDIHAYRNTSHPCSGRKWNNRYLRADDSWRCLLSVCDSFVSWLATEKSTMNTASTTPRRWRISNACVRTKTSASLKRSEQVFSLIRHTRVYQPGEILPRGEFQGFAVDWDQRLADSKWWNIEFLADLADAILITV